MRVLRTLWKRNAALPLLIVTIVYLTTTISNIQEMKDCGRYVLQHIYGNPSVLQDVNITGVLQDAHHWTSFAVQNGEVTSQTYVYDNPRRLKDYRSSMNKDRLEPLQELMSNSEASSINLEDAAFAVFDEILKNGKRYTALIYEENLETSIYGIVSPQQLYLFAWDDDELLYHGVLKTDLAYDLIPALNSKSFNYGWQDIRHFYDVEIE